MHYSFKMSCHCTNSFKYQIISFLENKTAPFEINNLIDEIYKTTSKKDFPVENFEECDETFLKGFIKSVIFEMEKEKMVQLKTIKTNEEPYYFMSWNRDRIKDLLSPQNKPQPEVEKQKEEGEKKEINQPTEKELKIKEYLQLKKNLDDLKKNSKRTRVIKLLHDYNDLKDIAQEILGRIANKRNITIKNLYEDLDIKEEEDE